MSNIETHNENNVQFQNIDYKFDQVGNVLSYTNKCLTGVNGNYSTTKRLFWSGFGDGGVIAEQYAKNGFITLEMTLENPPSFLENPTFWKEVSADFAKSAKGDVSALLVTNFSFEYPGANTFKDVEFDILLSNPDVTSINLIW